MRVLFLGGVRRTLLLLLLVVLVPELVVEVTNYYRTTQDRRGQELQASLEEARSMGFSVDMFIEGMLHQELILGKAMILPQSLSQANDLLNVSLAGDARIRQFSWMDPECRILASSVPQSVGSEFTDRRYCQEIKDGREWVVTDLFREPSGGEPAFAVLQGTWNDSGKLMGIVGATVDPHRLGSVLGRLGDQGDALIIDSQGLIVFRYPEVAMDWEERNIPGSHPAENLASSGDEFSGVVPVDGRQRLLTALAPIKSTGWTASVSRTENEVIVPEAGKLFRDASLQLWITLAALLVAVVIARNITAPVARLRRNAIAIGKGDLRGRVEVSGPHELQALASSFNIMADEIEAREEILQRYQLLSEHARDIIVFVRSDGTIIEANDAASRAYGYSREELLSMNLDAMEAAGSDSPVTARIAGAGSAGILFEALQRRQDGSTFPVEVSAKNAMIGCELVFLVILRDITWRKKSEMELQLRSSLLDAASDSVFLHDSDFRTVYVNEAAHKSRGYSRDELLSVGLLPLLAPDYATLVEERKMALQEQGEMVFDSAHLRKDGSVMPVEVHNRLIQLGGTEYTLSVIRDITDRKRAEEERERLLAELQEKNEQLVAVGRQVREQAEEAERRASKLNTVITSMPDGLVIYSPSMEILHMNPAAEYIFGFTEEERKLPYHQRLAVSRPHMSDGRPLSPDELPALRAMRGEQVQGLVVVFRVGTDRAVWISCSSAPIYAAGGELLGAVTVFTDITSIRRLEEQREGYISLVSHDLRNPLAVIQGHAQALLRALQRLGLAGSEKRSAEDIITSAKRMSAMIQDLVDSVRLESGQLQLQRQPIPMSPFVADLLVRIAPAMEVGRIRVDIPPGLPLADADQDRLERVMVNLLTNALKYSPANEDVWVRAALADGDLVITVEDRGVGIADEDVPHIFERFYRPRSGRKPGGLGLGLYICKILVEAHGGHIWVDSQVGVGTKIHFTLRSV